MRFAILLKSREYWLWFWLEAINIMSGHKSWPSFCGLWFCHYNFQSLCNAPQMHPTAAMQGSGPLAIDLSAFGGTVWGEGHEAWFRRGVVSLPTTHLCFRIPPLPLNWDLSFWAYFWDNTNCSHSFNQILWLLSVFSVADTMTEVAAAIIGENQRPEHSIWEKTRREPKSYFQ